MRIAVISDIHGNMHALEVVLADIKSQQVDQIICTGDIVNPFLRSLEAWELLKSLNIPCLRGNHEDYLAWYHHPDPNISSKIRDAYQFKPVQLVADHLGPNVVTELSLLPLTMQIDGLFLCHASPSINNKSYFFGIDAEMERDLNTVAHSMIVAGHIHYQWHRQWNEKSLVIAGSVGLPHRGKPHAEYVILTRSRTHWIFEHRTKEYDNQAALLEYRESGCVSRGGPTAWLLYDEIWCAKARLAKFLPNVFSRPQGPPRTRNEWEVLAREFLESIGRWDALRPFLG